MLAPSVHRAQRSALHVAGGHARCSGVVWFFLIASPVFVSIATFAVYSVYIGDLMPEVIFPSLAYFNLLRVPMTFVPALIICTRRARARRSAIAASLLTLVRRCSQTAWWWRAALVEARISVKRLQEFLLDEEMEDPPTSVKGEVRAAYNAEDVAQPAPADVLAADRLLSLGLQIRMRMNRASFSWGGKQVR